MVRSNSNSADQACGDTPLYDDVQSVGYLDQVDLSRGPTSFSVLQAAPGSFKELM